MRLSITFLLLGWLACSTEVFGATQIDAAQWRNVQTYDVVALKNIEEMQIQRLVGVRFNFRGKRLRHVKPNWYEASIWQANPKEKSGFSFLRVLVAQSDLPAFQSLPTEFNATQQNLLYGRVLKDFDAHYLFIEAIGRRAVVDAAGRARISW